MRGLARVEMGKVSRLAVPFAITVVVMLGSGCSHASRRTLTGTLEIGRCDQTWSASAYSPDNPDFPDPTARCAVSGGPCAVGGIYGSVNVTSTDVAVGAQVLVTDAQSNKLIGVGSVPSAGVWALSSKPIGVGNPGGMMCEFAFSVPDMPTAKYYNIAIGTEHWGVFTDAKLKADKYNVVLLGS